MQVKVLFVLLRFFKYYTLNYRRWRHQPPTCSKFTQNNLLCLCSICAGLCCKKISLGCFSFLDRLSKYYLVIILRSCSKFTQNNHLCLCSICAGLCRKKISLGCFSFLDIKIIFNDHSEVTQPPTCSKFPRIASFVCATFVLVCAAESLVCAASVFKILDITLSVDDVTSPPTRSKLT